ncbi:alpha/beta fold hydrolase [Actinoplanes sp. L3-i22]|uniref:alpha/beta fold hydrolase n=1 Tax=Actinoplanes sp. L3-i22 TaxID=2836373 RepID=UPI001C7482B3|nr:alpha/beta hydrolase [Actinoplanes sp. L3-i22]BCY10441.1 carboxylesterase [Actinoplanes sp. L3-i22]
MGFRSGAAEGVPVVLVPGSTGNALTWYRYVETLGREHPVIALDPIGEPGEASQTRPIRDAGDVAAALEETLAGLGVERAHLVGMSYGGWAVLRHELAFPGRAASLTLLDPGGFGRLGAKFWIWLAAGAIAGLAPGPLRRRLSPLVRNAVLRDENLIRLLPLAMRFRRRLPLPDTVTDAELAALTVPTLMMLGEHSALYSSIEVAARVRRVLPAARVEIVPGASHDLPAHSPDLVAERISGFIR